MSNALTLALIGLIIVIACANVAVVPMSLLPLGCFGIAYGAWHLCKWIVRLFRERPAMASARPAPASDQILAVIGLVIIAAAIYYAPARMKAVTWQQARPMVAYKLTSPDGTAYNVTAPEGATEGQVWLATEARR
jgi:hypothetical protein